MLTRSSVALFLLAAVATSQNENTTQEFDSSASRGTITQVVALEDPAQSYALHLPTQYSPDAAGR